MKTIKNLLAKRTEDIEKYFTVAKLNEKAENFCREVKRIIVTCSEIIDGRIEDMTEDSYYPTNTELILNSEYRLKNLIDEGMIDLSDRVEAIYIEVRVEFEQKYEEYGEILPLVYRDLYINDKIEIIEQDTPWERNDDKYTAYFNKKEDYWVFGLYNSNSMCIGEKKCHEWHSPVFFEIFINVCLMWPNDNNVDCKFLD